MFTGKSIIFLVLSIAVGGCAIHPLPNDVLSARLDTVSIVRHIRCEARMAFKLAIADYFQNTEQFAVDSQTYRLGAQLRYNSFPFANLNRHLRGIDRDAAANVLRYEKTVIGFDFSFDMSEDNGYTTQIDFLQVLTGGTAGLGLKAGADFQRQTIRLFRVTDTFAELMLLDEQLDCSDGRSSDFAFPVRGNIGIGEMVKTFVQLNESERLTGAKQGDKVPVLSDTFNFQTTLNASATPTISLSPVGHRFGLADANIGAAGTRKDIHKVIIAMSLPVEPGQEAVGSGVGLVSGVRLPAKNARERVNRALDDQINRSIINQLSIVPR